VKCDNKAYSAQLELGLCLSLAIFCLKRVDEIQPLRRVNIFDPTLNAESMKPL
jgi:hypothetical protein